MTKNFFLKNINVFALLAVLVCYFFLVSNGFAADDNNPWGKINSTSESLFDDVLNWIAYIAAASFIGTCILAMFGKANWVAIVVTLGMTVLMFGGKALIFGIKNQMM